MVLLKLHIVALGVIKIEVRGEVKETRSPECWVTAWSFKSTRMITGLKEEMKTELVSKVINELVKQQEVDDCSKENRVSSQTI